MRMSHPPAGDLDQLHSIADEVRETHADRGYLVGRATALDPAFRLNRGPKSAMDRNLVIEAVERGASQVGMAFVPGRGGATELKVVSDAGYRVYRLRRATKLQTGEYLVQNNSASAWAGLDEDTLMEDQFWVLGYTLSDDGIDEIFTARVLGFTEGNPGRLLLGPHVLLGSSVTHDPSGGFRPSEEGLDDLFDEDDDTAAGEESA